MQRPNCSYQQRLLDIKAPDSSSRRIDNANDFVRIEIRAALERKIPVVPFLLSDAIIPSEDKLPSDLQDLSRRQAFETADIDRDMRKFLTKIRPFIVQKIGEDHIKIPTEEEIFYSLGNNEASRYEYLEFINEFPNSRFRSAAEKWHDTRLLGEVRDAMDSEEYSTAMALSGCFIKADMHRAGKQLFEMARKRLLASL